MSWSDAACRETLCGYRVASGRDGLGFGGRRVADDVEGAGRAVGPAGVVDGGEGCGTVAGVAVVGNAVEGMDVGRVVIPEGLADGEGW